MRAWIVTVGERLAPFDVVADEVPVGDGRLGDIRKTTLIACGLEPVVARSSLDDQFAGPALVIADDVWITRRALRTFLAETRSLTKTVRLRLPHSRLTELTLPLQDVDVDDAGAVYSCAFIPAGVTMTAREAFAAPGHTIAYRELPARVPLPRALVAPSMDGALMWPLTSTVVLRVRHWLHVLRASHLAPQVWLIEHALRHPLQSTLRAVLGLRVNAAAREAAWRRQFRFVGKRCLIHPSAVVEGSVIADDVVIGPNAVVLNSVIGAGSRLEQRTHVSQCVLSPRTFMSLNSSMQACVTFPDADACANNLQGCVIGTKAGLTSFARALDTTLDADGLPVNVRVKDGDALRDVGPLPVGACFGPGSYIGANVTIAAGRVVPAGVRIIAGDAAAVVRTDVERGLYRTQGGALISSSSPS